MLVYWGLLRRLNLATVRDNFDLRKPYFWPIWQFFYTDLKWWLLQVTKLIPLKTGEIPLQKPRRKIKSSLPMKIHKEVRQSSICLKKSLWCNKFGDCLCPLAQILARCWNTPLKTNRWVYFPEKSHISTRKTNMW